MRSGACLTLMLLVSGCASAVSDRAICDGTIADRSAHAAALAQDGGDLSVTTGQVLIQKLDAACGY
jgi:hypothetical protein